MESMDKAQGSSTGGGGPEEESPDLQLEGAETPTIARIKADVTARLSSLLVEGEADLASKLQMRHALRLAAGAFQNLARDSNASKKTWVARIRASVINSASKASKVRRATGDLIVTLLMAAAWETKLEADGSFSGINSSIRGIYAGIAKVLGQLNGHIDRKVAAGVNLAQFEVAEMQSDSEVEAGPVPPTTTPAASAATDYNDNDEKDDDGKDDDDNNTSPPNVKMGSAKGASSTAIAAPANTPASRLRKSASRRSGQPGKTPAPSLATPNVASLAPAPPTGRGNYSQHNTAKWTSQENITLLEIYRDHPETILKEKTKLLNDTHWQSQTRSADSVRQQIKKLTKESRPTDATRLGQRIRDLQQELAAQPSTAAPQNVDAQDADGDGDADAGEEAVGEEDQSAVAEDQDGEGENAEGVEGEAILEANLEEAADDDEVL